MATTLLCPTPQNIVPLIGSGNYYFYLTKFPEITFQVQEVEIPSLSLGSGTVASPLVDWPIAGDKAVFDQLSVTFIVDENMTNYKAINDWIVGLGFPSSHQLYTNLMNNSKNQFDTSELYKSTTDGVLTVLDNAQHPTANFIYRDCFPIQISGMRFDSRNSEGSPVTATAVFAYSYYEMETAT